ncbi:uncharacterized protein LOC141718699 [Apium graveolens]|uniref:uncharacterized protein LOC141718699 n=1 Tax=Apium graveolens TaxID=4045 RepID=UPI003D7BF67D
MAKEAWEAIKMLCQGADRVKKEMVQTLKAEFELLSMKDSEQLDDFYMRLNGIVTNIQALGEKIEESYVVKKLLYVVPTRFLQITSTIEQIGDLETMSVKETLGSLKAHEERMNGKNENSGGKLLLTEEEWSKRETEGKKLLLTIEEWLNIYGHYTSECQNDVSNHMTGLKSEFTELNEGITGLVKFGDGSTVKIEAKGSMTLVCKNGEERVLK